MRGFFQKQQNLTDHKPLNSSVCMEKKSNSFKLYKVMINAGHCHHTTGYLKGTLLPVCLCLSWYSYVTETH